MARIGPPKKPSLLARVAYWITRRKVGRVVMPVKITAHHTRLLRGVAGMEMAQEAARTMPARLKLVAQVLAATRVGCPF